MMRVTGGLVAGALLSVAAAAFAGPAWSQQVKVTIVDIESDPTSSGVGEIYLRFNTLPTFTANPDCKLNASDTTPTAYGANFFVIGGNADTVKAVLSTALAAKLSGNPVRVLWNNTYGGAVSCQGGGHLGYPVLRGLTIE